MKKRHEQNRMWVDSSSNDGNINRVLRRSGGDKAGAGGRQRSRRRIRGSRAGRGAGRDEGHGYLESL